MASNDPITADDASLSRNLSHELEPPIAKKPKTIIGNEMKEIRTLWLIKQDNYNAKIKRTRESARNTRERKNFYIQLLERKVNALQDDIKLTQKQIELTSEAIDNATKSASVTSGFCFIIISNNR